MNEGSDMGYTTRNRMSDKADRGEQKWNRIHIQYRQARERGFTLVQNTLSDTQIPTQTNKYTKWKKIRINGREKRLPSDHFGTWGGKEEKEKKKKKISFCSTSLPGRN